MLHISRYWMTIIDFIQAMQGGKKMSNSTLKYIVDNNLPSWKTALSNVKGVYIIVDTKNGKQYVGSAYGDECIWQR